MRLFCFWFLFDVAAALANKVYFADFAKTSLANFSIVGRCDATGQNIPRIHHLVAGSVARQDAYVPCA